MNKFAAFYLESFSKYADESGITAGDVGAVGATGAAGILAASPQAREWSMSNLIRKPIGRVVTNLVRPIGYGRNLSDAKRKPFGSLMSVIRDKPIYGGGPGSYLADREVPYRAMFDLKPRPGFENPGLYTGSGKSFSFNPKHLDGARMISEISSLPHPHGHDVMGGYKRSVTPQGSVRYWDRWDMDLHPHESIIRSPNLARWAASKITKPVTISGEIPQAASLNPAMKIFSDDDLLRKYNEAFQENPNALLRDSALLKKQTGILEELNARKIRAEPRSTSLGSGSEPVAPTSPDKAHPGLRSEIASTIKGTGAGLLNKVAPVAATVGRAGTAGVTGVAGSMMVDKVLPPPLPDDGYWNRVQNNFRDTQVAIGGGALGGAATGGYRGALVGAIGGGIGDIVNKTITTGKTIRNTDWKSLGRSALGVNNPELEAAQRRVKNKNFAKYKENNLLPQSSNPGDSSFYSKNGPGLSLGK